MTPRFRRILEAAFWFVVGFVVHGVLIHFHHHPWASVTNGCAEDKAASARLPGRWRARESRDGSLWVPVRRILPV